MNKIAFQLECWMAYEFMSWIKRKHKLVYKGVQFVSGFNIVIINFGFMFSFNTIV